MWPPAQKNVSILVSALLGYCLSVPAQTVFHSSSLPGHIGDYSRAYLSTNVNISALIAPGTNAQRWDISQLQQPDELIQRTDIVAADDGGNQASFPGAVFAERDTDEPNSQVAWRYYALTNQGRLYYGFNNPVDDPVTPLVVFDQPTCDIPASVQFGQSWNRSVNWTNTVLVSFLVAYHFTANVQVEAYGTLVLPGIGEVSALRVKEVHDNEASEYISGSWFPIVSQTNVFYYWLSPRVGVAAQVLLLGNNTVFPDALPNTNSFLRVFESNLATNLPGLSPVTGLRLQIQGNQALLNWNQPTNSVGYQVESIGHLTATNWQVLGFPVTNLWTDSLVTTQRFYRVFYNQ
jgi:hypothetical protein